MTVHYTDDQIVLHHGDALDVLPTLPDTSVDAVVCDPPYGLEFMGEGWDTFKPSNARLRTRIDGRTNPAVGKSTVTTPEAYIAGLPFQQWCKAWAAECLRILKPGGYLLAFGGTRTVHRLTCGIEDAGFEIRDGIDWLYGQGFPKSLNVGDGRGTALKPAREPIVVARKPFAGTVAANVLEFGTGAFNIDSCRIPAGPDYATKCASVVGLASNRNGDAYGEWTGIRADSAHAAGRWPSNVVLSHAGNDVDGDFCADCCVAGCPVAELDAQSGVSASRAYPPRDGRKGDGWRLASTGTEYDDVGGASRFFPIFRYEAKAGSGERPRVDGVAHPTVKPLALMRWLVQLVTPSGGTVLDWCTGSGTTVEACLIEGYPCLAVEREAKYLPLIMARISKPITPVLFGDLLGGAA